MSSSTPSADSGFLQEPPQLSNQYDADALLRSHLRRSVDPDVLGAIEPSLQLMGELAAGRLLDLARVHRRDEPVHVPFDPWGRRIDEVHVNDAWREYARVAAEQGLIALAYERAHGRFSRVQQFALAYLFHPSSQVYTCPLAMTDGCARTLEVLGGGLGATRDRIVSHLTSRDPAQAWTSGQWMTERIGGSDVGLSETVARSDGNGGFTLHGTKWFTSAVTSQVALTLARPERNGLGGKGLALFLVELRDSEQRLQHITVLRLKDKLGTRNLPTAELLLDGTPALAVAGLSDGVRNMGAMLNLTRTWNAVCAAATQRRALMLARDFARRRVAFGATLAEKPLHLDTLADLAAAQQASFQLTFFAVELLGRQEAGELDARGDSLLRVVQPLAKLTTARHAVGGASEVLEAFGGAGYVEDTGLPELLRDAQVLSIWEGTTNVLALEVYRALLRADALPPALELIRSRAEAAAHRSLREASGVALRTADHLESWWSETETRVPWLHESSARRFALTLGRTLALALLIEHADWAIANERDGRFSEAARRYARSGVDLLCDAPRPPLATTRLALGEALDPELL